MATAAILAGGSARRMGGRNKYHLRLNGRTFLDRQIAAVRPCVNRVLLVGCGTETPAVRSVDLVADRVPGCGPLGGLDAALAAAETDDVLLLACDLPHVTTALVGYLVSLRVGIDAVVPRTERGYHPLCAVYAQSCREVIERRLERRQLRMLDLLDELRVRTVGSTELARFGTVDHLLTNVNTPAELDALESLSQ